ncbi:MAG TPA: hypothetical protein VEW42_03795 [Candidatus Eisenbacteria bacterium]|nr:hypothetical protein [Candidatus Eisenbacteria bacterium]
MPSRTIDMPQDGEPRKAGSGGEGKLGNSLNSRSPKPDRRRKDRLQGASSAETDHFHGTQRLRDRKILLEKAMATAAGFVEVEREGDWTGVRITIPAGPNHVIDVNRDEALDLHDRLRDMYQRRLALHAQSKSPGVREGARKLKKRDGDGPIPAHKRPPQREEEDVWTRAYDDEKSP